MNSITLEQIEIGTWFRLSSGGSRKYVKSSTGRGDELLAHPLSENDVEQRKIDIWMHKLTYVSI